MGFSDILEFGMSLREGRTYGQNIEQLKKNYPDDYLVYRELEKAYKVNKLVPIPYNTGFASEKLKKNLFSQEHLRTISLIVPQQKRMTIAFRPEHVIFGADNYELIRLCNWVNSKVFAGRLKIGHYISGKEVVEPIFDFTLSYQGLENDQVFAIAFRIIDSIKEYAQTLAPLIQSVADRSIRFNTEGALVGNAAQELTDLFLSSSSFSYDSPEDVHLGLQNKLELFLETNQVGFEKVRGKEIFKLNWSPNTKYAFEFFAYVTRQNQLVTEMHLPLEPNKSLSAITHSKYMVLMNSIVNVGGVFYIDKEKNTVCYRTGIDASGIEEYIGQPVFDNILVEHEKMSTWLTGFQEVMEGNDTFEIVETIANKIGEPEVLGAAREYLVSLDGMFRDQNQMSTLAVKIPDQILPVTEQVKSLTDEVEIMSQEVASFEKQQNGVSGETVQIEHISESRVSDEIKCLDCGSPFPKSAKYCPVCGAWPPMTRINADESKEINAEEAVGLDEIIITGSQDERKPDSGMSIPLDKLPVEKLTDDGVLPVEKKSGDNGFEHEEKRTDPSSWLVKDEADNYHIDSDDLVTDEVSKESIAELFQHLPDAEEMDRLDDFQIDSVSENASNISSSLLRNHMHDLNRLETPRGKRSVSHASTENRKEVGDVHPEPQPWQNISARQPRFTLKDIIIAVVIVLLLAAQAWNIVRIGQLEAAVKNSTATANNAQAGVSTLQQMLTDFIVRVQVLEQK